MSFIPKPHEIYKHFKGNLYQIVTVAEHTESGEQLVIYQALYGEFKTYARPLHMFVSRVDREKYPDVEQEFRFELQGAENTAERREEQRKENRKEVVGEAAEDTSEITLDPMVLEFLDADSYEQRLNILAGLHHRITDEMIATMAIACDVEINEGDIEEKYEALRNCLLTLEKYECNRIR